MSFTEWILGSKKNGPQTGAFLRSRGSQAAELHLKSWSQTELHPRLEMGFDVWSSERIDGFTPRSSECFNVLPAVKNKNKNSQSPRTEEAT